MKLNNNTLTAFASTHITKKEGRCELVAAAGSAPGAGADLPSRGFGLAPVVHPGVVGHHLGPELAERVCGARQPRHVSRSWPESRCEPGTALGNAQSEPGAALPPGEPDAVAIASELQAKKLRQMHAHTERFRGTQSPILTASVERESQMPRLCVCSGPGGDSGQREPDAPFACCHGSVSRQFFQRVMHPFPNPIMCAVPI